jgi:hypothetical protein
MTLEAQLAHIGPRDLALGVPTYNNAETVGGVTDAALRGIAEHFADASVVLINADGGSSDGTPELLKGVGVPVVTIPYPAPMQERSAVPFHGVPGRGAALHATLGAARHLGAKVTVLLEADVTSIVPDWIARLAGPVWDEKADFVAPAYARHRWEGSITNLLLGPLVRALYGRRLRQPLGGQQALSTRLVEHLLLHPKWNWTGRDLTDLWIAGAAIADGFSVWEAWLGPRQIRSRTRTSDLPTMIAQTLGSVFSVMDRHEDLWMEVRGGESLPSVGDPLLPSAEPRAVDTERMLESFRLGLRDLTPIWEHVLAPETLGDVLSLDTPGPTRFAFPDALWARVVYDFALGHHYGVVHRDHLLRSLVPLYLGRAAAFVLATGPESAEATERRLEAIGRAFEREKPYLVERWR